MKKFLVYIFTFFIFYSNIFACTTTLVGKDATVDGSVIVSHSDDDELGDQRIIYVPAADYEPGAKRPVYYDPCCFGGENIRYVGSSRGPGYVDPKKPQTKPIGYIDQVEHTYAYFDGNYGIMNEHQLMFGECTNGTKHELKPKPGKLIFYSAELSRVALERCKTARQAIILMGQLIEKHGYYGTGETLLVGDTKEGWVFEMCPSPEEKGGLWVAKRVPDDEMFVAANEFRIREVNKNDPNMMYSKSLFDVTKKYGWWNPKDGEFDWLRAVSYGEYNHPYYSLRRVWRVMSRANPSLNLSPWVKDGFTKDYPFTIKPAKKLTPRDVMSLHRDHYEGTEFDLRKGMASGPFGTPQRYIGTYDGKQNDVSSPEHKAFGAWERPLSVFYCGYMYVNQARGWLPDSIGGVCWFGPDKPYETCFVPFYVGVNQLPKSYSTGSTSNLDRNVAWWAFNFVSNIADLKYSYMIKDIQTKQKRIENKEFNSQQKIEQKALTLYKKNPKDAIEYLTTYCVNNANKVVKAWWNLGDDLIQKYSDGYVNQPKIGKEVGYPRWWLDKVGYASGPISYQKPTEWSWVNIVNYLKSWMDRLF